MLHGKKMASVIFQRTTDQVSEDNIENIFCYHDNICICNSVPHVDALSRSKFLNTVSEHKIRKCYPEISLKLLTLQI